MIGFELLGSHCTEQWGQIVTSIVNKKVSGSRSTRDGRGWEHDAASLLNLPYGWVAQRKGRPVHAQRLHTRCHGHIDPDMPWEHLCQEHLCQRPQRQLGHTSYLRQDHFLE